MASCIVLPVGFQDHVLSQEELVKLEKKEKKHLTDLQVHVICSLTESRVCHLVLS